MRKQVVLSARSFSMPVRLLVVRHTEINFRRYEGTKRLVLLLCLVVFYSMGCHKNNAPDASDSRVSSESTGLQFPSSGEFRPTALGMELIVLNSRKELDANLGKLVALRGVVSNTKRAVIIGVEISPEGLRGKEAYAVGILSKSDESHQAEDVSVQRTRGSTGATYILYSDLSGNLSIAREWPATASKSTEGSRQR